MTCNYGMFFGILVWLVVGVMGCSAWRWRAHKASTCEDQVQFQNLEHCAEAPETKSECVFAYLLVAEVCAKAHMVKALTIVFPQEDGEQRHVVVFGRSVNRGFRLRVTITPDWSVERIADELRQLVIQLERKLEQPLPVKEPTPTKWEI